MMDANGDDLSDPEFPPLEDDPILEETDLEGEPDSREDLLPGDPPDPAWEIQPGSRVPFSPPAEDPPAFAIDEGGELFSPENDPLLEPPPPLPPVPIRQPMPPRYIPQRLRHLVSEPKHPVYKDFSGRNPRRG